MKKKKKTNYNVDQLIFKWKVRNPWPFGVYKHWMHIYDALVFPAGNLIAGILIDDSRNEEKETCK